MVELDDQPIVMGELNGKRAYFLIDTGSDLTILNLKAARKYGFKIRSARAGKYKISGLDSEHRGRFLLASRAELILGGRSMRGSYKVFDLSHIVKSIMDDTGIRITGIIGSDLMKKRKFVIDYEAEEISFTPHQPGKFPEPD